MSKFADEILKDMSKGILNWYDFKEGSTVLHISENENSIADLEQKKMSYDYIVLNGVIETCEDIQELFASYPNLNEIVWVQEEPKNMGAWNFVEPRLRTAAPEGVKVDYIGRRRRSSPAEGDPTIHKQGQNRIITSALTRK